MAKDLYPTQKAFMEHANDILGFRLTDILFEGTAEDLRATRVTQPAIFLHSLAAARQSGLRPDMVAGHSLGEFSALVVAGALDFDEALPLVALRARLMQACCDRTPGAMAAVLGTPEALVRETCAATPGVVVPANFNSEGQIVISGEAAAVEKAGAALKEAGARRVVPLPVSGAFHSPLMEPARKELAQAIGAATFHSPACPVYQNVTAKAETSPERIRENLLAQLTAPVLWTQTIQRMVQDGAERFVEMGPGNVLQGLVRKILGDKAEGLSIEGMS